MGLVRALLDDHAVYRLTRAEIAGLVRYLADPDSGYITGEVIDITGGIDL